MVSMATPPRPEALEVRPRHIPQALKKARGWVMWRYAFVNGKWTKPPFNEDGKKIDAHDPTKWMTFSQAVQAYHRGGFDGIGLSLNAMEALAGVDLDHCIQGGKIEPWALEIVEELGSYVEISPSGGGLRILGYGKLRREGRKKGNVEVYDGGRYLTVTGHRLDSATYDIEDFDEALNRVHRRVWAETPKAPTAHSSEGKVGVDLAERFAALCDDDPKFKDRYYSPASVGDRSDHEFHLCARLWEEGFSESEIRSLMDSSPQEKWRERGADGYRDTTIRRAVQSAAAPKATASKGVPGTEGARQVFGEDDVTFIDDKAKRKFSPDKAARAILARYEVVSTPDEKIWVYQDGVFSPDGDYIIGKALDEAAGDLASIHMKRETLAKVRLRTREEYDIFDSDPCLFPVQNGVIDLRRGPDGFMPHDPKYKRTWKAPVIFDRKAVCPEIKKYLSTSLDEDGRKTLIDIMAAKLTAYNFPYFSPWVGRGRNGKRLATEIIRGIWGDPQITEVEVHKFHERRFDQIEVKGRYFIINNEVPRTATKGFDWVKKISGGDPITADVKGRDQVQFRPHAFLIYDCNNPPRIDDYTKAIEERIAPIWWNYSFVDKPDTTDPREKQRDPHLEGKITSPSELSGFLNVLLQEVPRLIETRAIHRPGTGKELAASYDLKADHLAIFWDRVMIFEPGNATSSTRAFEQYCELCRTAGVSPVSRIIFNRYGRKRGFRDGRPYFTGDDGLSVRARGWYDCILDEEELEDLLHPNRPDRTDGTGRGRDLDRKNRHARMEGTDIHSFNTTIENRDNIDNSCIGGDIDKKAVQPVPSAHGIDSSDKPRPKTAKPRPLPYVGGTDSEKPRIFGLSIYETIAEGLEEAARREADYLEHVKTPEEDRLPTAEEAEVLEDLAGRILENWPGLPEMLLWEKARGKLGSRLPLVVVRYWLSESGYIETGEKYGGGAIWNLPTSEEAVL